MKILASGDHHFHRAGPRWEECMRIHAWMVELARERGVDLFLSGGDMTEHASTAEEREAIADWLQCMASTCPVVVADGNHAPGHTGIMRRLRTPFPVIVEERARVHRVASARGGVAAIAAVAWPSRASLAASIGRALPGDAADDVAREALRGVLLGMRTELDAHDGPRILLGHFMVDGSVTSVGQPLVGHAFNVGLSDLALAGAHLGVMAHVHKPQEWVFDGVTYAYTGSPYRTAYGETEEKSVLLAEFDGPRLVSLERIPTPCTGMLLGEDEWGWSEERQRFEWLVGWHGLDPDEAQGAEVRLRFHVAPDQREGARLAAEAVKADLLARGAASVKVEEVVRPHATARAPEIGTAEGLPAQLDAYWRAAGVSLTDGRKTRLLGMAESLRGETA